MFKKYQDRCQRFIFFYTAVLVISWHCRVILSAQVPSSLNDVAALQSGFQDPPKTARPSAYYLLLNGYMNRSHVGPELEQLHKMGVRGLCVFDMGGRGRKEALPPAGPVFMSEEWLENFSHLIQKAGALDMDVQLAVSSSWDMGASWVRPEQASMALYHSSLVREGPGEIKEMLPFPKIPAAAPRDENGNLLFHHEVAVLAFPETKRQPGHEFVFQLPGPGLQRINHVVLYNTTSDDSKRHGPLHLFSKDFSIAVSRTDSSEKNFREILRASLAPHTKAQRFDFSTTEAKYVRLRLHNGHNPKFDRIQLGEFEVYSVEGRNVAGSHVVDRTKDSAILIRYSSEWGHNGEWTAENIHDGAHMGAGGSWSSAGPPPLIIKDPGSIIDLTNRMDAQGRLEWKAPAGKWVIMRFVCANTGERLKVPSPSSNGLATDHFSAEATRDYIRYLTDCLEKRLGDLGNTCIKQLYLPSYEVRGAKWTPDFIEQFRRYRGYDLLPYLPALRGYVVTSQEITDRFLYDFRKTLGDLLVDAYYRTASTSARRVGLGIEAESGGPGPPVHQVPVDALKALGAIDEVRGEYWPWRIANDSLWVVKETACAAHIYGKRRVHMEAFTGFSHWQDGPFELKPSADRAFCEGMNHVVWHTSSHQPPEAGKPGWVYGAGTHLTPSLVWGPMAEPFLTYLSRCSFMLQQGHFVGDVCYYYGDQGYNFVPPKHIDPALGYGYDYDVTNAEVILNRMSVRDGRIVLPDGMQYELLVLPDRQDMDLPVLRKLGEMVQAGATVAGPKPIRSNGLTGYPKRDQEVKLLADSLWGNCDGKNVLEHSYGKGKVIWGRFLRDILTDRGIGPDFHYTSENKETKLDYIHRRTPEADIYFIRNKTMRWEMVDGYFRVSGKRPELWYPETGEIRDQLVYEQTSRGVRVPLRLAPAGSLFVVFCTPKHPSHLITADSKINVTKVTDKAVHVTVFHNGTFPVKTSKGQSAEIKIDEVPPVLFITGPWNVRFAPGWGAPEEVKWKTLTSWTEQEDPGIRYFSGAARYETELRIPPEYPAKDRKLYLDLGRLWCVGEVFLNGQSLGVIWKPPYRVEITKAARPGSNQLAIVVANTWANRLVGDALTSNGKTYCRTNITRSGTPGKAWKDIPLHESGLLGPVTLQAAIEKTIVLPQ